MRVKQYRDNPKACIYFCDELSFRGVMLKGTMEVVDAPAVKREIWREEFSIYYEGGMDGGDFIILKFTAQTGRLYGNYHSENFDIE